MSPLATTGRPSLSRTRPMGRQNTGGAYPATRVRPWSSANVRVEFRRLAARAGLRRRFAPHQLRHAHAVEMAREGVPLIVIQRQLGHTNLGITSIYLQGIDNAEIIDTVHARRAPMVPVHSSLRR